MKPSTMSVSIGQTISHYRITGQLGSGGMGIVYEAQDVDLGRAVALKFLPSDLSRDQNALDRFLLEARTASALNHPNICTIYAVEKVKVGNEGEQSFIAMELLEGETLDRRLSSGPLPLDRLLEWAIQLADAMDAAHAKRIIHRDIKPANIFITPRGQIKVLDFGLAKLARPEIMMETIGATQDSPAPANLTNPGATVGTIAYMSPEQARGEELDPRTDLFSLGVVIYQMAAGRLPYSGATSAVVFHAILELDPVPALQLNPTLPPKLDEIIAKALEKERDLRYQSAADLRGDLRRLKRDTESGRKAAQTASGSAAAVRSATPSAEVMAVSTASRTSGSSAVITAARQNRIGSGLIAGIVVLLIAAAGYGMYSFLTHRRPAAFQEISLAKVTDTGNEVFVAISPDGKYVLCMSRKNGLASLWLRNVPTNSNTEVQPPEDTYYNGLQFSPDGNYFYFVRSDPGNSELMFLYRAPLLGGRPQKLATDVDSNITFSPDGKKIAFMRYDNPEPGKYQLVVRSVDGGDESALTSGPTGESLYKPTWSPNGKVIVCEILAPRGGVLGLAAVDAVTGRQNVFFTSGTRIVERPSWLPDGSGIVGLIREQSTNFTRSQIGFISYPKGLYSPITRDTNSYTDLSIASSGHILATVQSQSHWNLMVMPSGGTASQVRQITSSDADTNFTWTRDNHLISDQANALNLIDPSTGAKTVVSAQGVSGAPWACGATDSIVIIRFQPGGQNIWRMDTSGANLKQITNGKLDVNPVCSHDGKWLFFVNQIGEAKLVKIPIEGGTPQVVSALPVTGAADLSPDDKLAAFATLQHTGEHKEMLALVEIDGGKLAKLVEFERPRFGLLRFSRDGKAVVYISREKGIDNLWQQPLDGSKGRWVTDFASERIYDFHWSFDGKQLALVRGHTDADVVLIRDSGNN
jgi:serine/threonine protein kinase/Tol biopolymer transport system component